MVGNIYLYLLTNTRTPDAVQIKYRVAHTARQSNIQAALSSIKLQWGLPRLMLANKWEVQALIPLYTPSPSLSSAPV